MKKRHMDWWRVSTFFICALFLLGGLCIVANQSMAKSKSVAHKQAFAVYAKKCLGCHDSVADPEKPGRTRDDWHLVVNVMHKYGMDLTADEADMIIDLLYDLRKGMEREAG
ncbi:cytochrome c [uncultured Desulfosarcina sp.]|uniref:c-type cytochrome n=1 Tax=uncultured Desulfosarcina sp. TaxID=218289 RepID=UPI0029C8AE56|nr:cytochrome c [uncultured Desulfosarcina sp.]